MMMQFDKIKTPKYRELSFKLSCQQNSGRTDKWTMLMI